jgi:hypothetical protein
MFDIPWGDLLPFLAFGIVVADASVAIRGDMSGWNKDLAGAERGAQTLGQRLRDALSPKNLIAGAGLLGAAVGIRELIGAAGEAAEKFRELQQTQLTVDEVFGNSAVVIEDWAARSAKAAGMSQREVFKAAATMGQTLQNMGFSAADAAQQVVILQQRAAEMALAFGTTPDRAILAITAAMRGERDTIEKFGVSIKQADVNSRVLALGLDTSTAAAKKNSEAMAILDIVMEQTANQAGRFERSHDDAATKMLTAQARIDDFMTTQFGPMVTSIQVGAVDVAMAVADTAEGVGQFFDETFGEENQRKVQALADTLGLSFNDASAMVRTSMAETGQSWDTTVDGMLVSADELAYGTVASFGRFEGAFVEAGRSAALAADEVMAAVPEAVLRHWAEIRQAGVDTMAAYNQGIFEGQNSFIAEIDNLLRMLDENLAPAEEIALLRGQKVTLLYERGIRQNDPGAVAAIDDMIAKINLRLNTLNGYTYGKNLMTTLAGGIYDYAALPGQAAGYAATKIRNQIQIRSEPPDHTSPLYGITKWGGNMVKTIAEGIYGELGTGSAAAGALAGALVPSLGGGAMSYGAPMTTAQGGNTYVLHVNGVPYTVGSPEEAVAQLVELGVMTEGRLS